MWYLIRIAVFAVTVALFATVKGNKNDFKKLTTPLSWTEVDEPVQLLKPDTNHKHLILIDKNVEILRNINGAVATVAVVGKFHSGKSFLMNQLMGKSAGFGIGPTVRPQTMGIWMWGMPLTIHQESGPLSVVFLDTEGFAANNISETYDAKIFAVATLLSSYLIYNSVKIIDQSDIDYLELLARRTQLFALRSQLSKAKWTQDFNHDLLSFPPLLWVVQDFVQSTDGLSPTEWLHRLMASHSRENEDYVINLLGIFNKIDCHTLFLPATQKKLLVDLSQAKEEDLTEDYRLERDALISTLFKNLKPKEKNNKPITGAELAALLRILVIAANEGSLSDVPTRWNSFIQHLQLTATEDCLQFYDVELDVLLSQNDIEPVVPKELQEWHNTTFHKSKELLKHLLYGLQDAIKNSITDLGLQIQRKFHKIVDMNNKKIELKCSEVQGRVMLNAEQKFGELQLPMFTSELKKFNTQCTNNAIQNFISEVHKLISAEAVERYVITLKGLLNNLGNAFLLKNNEAIEAYLKNAMKLATEKFQDLTKHDGPIPYKPSHLTKIIKEASQQALRIYGETSLKFKNEDIYKALYALLKVNIQDYSAELHQKNEKLVKNLGLKTLDELLASLEEKTSQQYLALPMREQDLDAKLKSQVQLANLNYQEKMGDFNYYGTFEELKQTLAGKLQSIVNRRKKENVEAFTREVAGPLGIAKQVINLSYDKYTTAFSLMQYMRRVCLLNLDEGKAKTWPVELKLQIVDHYLNSDPDVKTIMKSKEGWWSAFVGFFQWILWLFGASF